MTRRLTVALCDEWLGELAGDRWDAAYIPHAWAREEIARIIGSPMRLPAPRDALRAAILVARSSLENGGS